MEEATHEIDGRAVVLRLTKKVILQPSPYLDTSFGTGFGGNVLDGPPAVKIIYRRTFQPNSDPLPLNLTLGLLFMEN